MTIEDITVRDYMMMSEEDQQYYNAIYGYSSPVNSYYNNNLDIMSDDFTFKKSIDLKKIVNATTLTEQVDILENIYNKKKGFALEKSMCNFTRSLKWIIECVNRVYEIEGKMLVSQIERKHAGYGEDRLEKFEWINIADAIATRYNITPFDVLKWGWYDTMVIMRYIDTVNYVGVKFNELLMNKN